MAGSILVLHVRMKGNLASRVYFSRRASRNTHQQNKKTSLTSYYTYILDLIEVGG